MRNGRYGNGNTDFSKLRVSKLPLHLFNKLDYQDCGCGATALAVITGINPKEIERKDKKYSDRFMLEFLRKNKISTYEITKCNLTKDKKIKYTLNDQNVILTNQLLAKNQSSWIIHYNGYNIHNFEIRAANFYDAINWPTISQYCVFNPNWLV